MISNEWPIASYFNSGTASAREVMNQLEFVDRRDWYELYRHKTDQTLWRLDTEDKYQQRFLVRVDDVSEWWAFDARPLHEALLQERRGGLGTAECIWQGCSERVLKGSAMCVRHMYDQGVRK
jgi:hypothetical protein